MPLPLISTRVLVAVAAGDALGMPVESMTASQIQTATGGVTDFIAPVQTRIADTMGLPAGATTDDWQLLAVTIRSLAACGGLDLLHMGQALVDAQRDPTRVGWGGTTEASVLAIGEWFDSDGATGHDPRDPVGAAPKGLGTGNAPAMRATALALFHGARGSGWQALARDVLALSRQTHGAPEAWWCAYAYARLLHGITVVGSGHASALAPGAASVRTVIEEMQQLDPIGSSTVCQQLRVALATDDELSLRAAVGNGFSALQSVVYAIGLWAQRSRGDGETLMLEAVNAGGDCDSTAAMVGALTYASTWQIPPSDWYERFGGEADALMRALMP